MLSKPKREDELVEPSKEAIWAASDRREQGCGTEDILKAAYAIDFHAHQQAMQQKNEKLEWYAKRINWLELERKQQAMQAAQEEIARLKKRQFPAGYDATDLAEAENSIELLEKQLEDSEQRAQALEARVKELTQISKGEAIAQFLEQGNVVLTQEKYDQQRAEIERLRTENTELSKHQIPPGWICHP